MDTWTLLTQTATMKYVIITFGVCGTAVLVVGSVSRRNKMFSAVTKSVNGITSGVTKPTTDDINKGYYGGGDGGTFWERLTGQK